MEVDQPEAYDLRHLHGRIPPLLQGAQPGLVSGRQYRHDGFRHVETLYRRLEAEIRRPLLQRLRHDDRPVRGLRTPVRGAVAARRLLRMGMDGQPLQRIQFRRQGRHVSPPSGAAGEPRSVQRLVGVVSQQARRLDRLPDFHAQATAHRRFLQQITRIAKNGRKRRTNTNALLFEEQGVSSCRMCPDRLRAGKTRLHSESKRRFRNVRLRGFCPFFR